MWYSRIHKYVISGVVVAVLGIGSVSFNAGSDAYAQFDDNLSIYGYFQNRFIWRTTDSNPILEPDESKSFMLQQLNLFLRKQFDPRFSAFVNVETTQNYSSQDNWGGIRIEEAWMRYRLSREFNVKAGLLIPTYNYLNRIKNRTPLLPYLIRPIVYESTLDNIISSEEYIPGQGFLEVYGTISLSQDWEAQYAAFLGNQDGFVTDIEVGSHPTGEDTSNAIAIGGRIALGYKALQFGISGTIDQANQSMFSFGGLEFPGTGVLDRYRIGVDVSRSFKKLFFNAELTKVMYETTPAIDQRLDEIRRGNPLIGKSHDKLFYYLVIGYYLNESIYVYGSHSYLEDQISLTLGQGQVLNSIGVGYQPIPQVVFKAQFMETHTRDATFLYYDLNAFLIGLSIIF